MNHTPSLEEAIQQFQHWRANRQGQRGLTPEHLQRLAIKLTEDHPVSTVVSALRINNRALKRWQQSLNPTEPKQPQFIPLPTAPEQPSVEVDSQSITLKLPNGITLSLGQSFSAERLVQLVSELSLLEKKQ